MLALPCCRRCGSVNWDGVGAEGASAIGSEELPQLRRLLRVGGGVGVCGTCPPPTWWPSAEAAADPAGGTGGTTPRVLGRQLPLPPPPPPPLGAFGQQLVAKGVALRRPWPPKAPDAP